ncbi:cytochrome P450 3A7-like [Oppia nitens]|uniref:cytochrome P450 3A7-like n=1 Tax=Oppia nitens TaxID=1686743 RepID=UPI0023D9C7FA|nr:cytochrome P450 3A7-like [Oppia nitens]
MRDSYVIKHMTDYRLYMSVHNKYSMVVLAQLFRPENMKLIEKSTETVCRQFMANYVDHHLPADGIVNVRHVMQELVMKIMIQCSFPTSFSELNLSIDQFIESAPQIDKNRRLLLTSVLIPRLTEYMIAAYGKVFGKKQQYFIDSITKMVGHRRRQLIDNNGFADKSKDFLQLFLDYRHNKAADKELTDYEIVSLFYVCYLSSYEPMCLMLMMAVYELAMKPLVQSRLYDELIAADMLVTNDDSSILELPFLNAVLMEILRKYPLPLTNRRAKEDVFLPDAGVTVPKGVDVELSFISLYHNSRYFTDPYDFNPDRFMAPAVDNQTQHSFIPFGCGQVVYCVGERFAKVVLKHALAKLIKTFEFKVADSTEIPFIFNRCPDILLPKSLNLGFKLRENIKF